MIADEIDLPREDILGVVVAEIDLGRSTDRNSLVLVVDDLHQTRLYPPHTRLVVMISSKRRSANNASNDTPSS